MRKGTTPTLEFTTPFKANDISKARVVFAYGHDIVLCKESDEDGCAILDNVIKITLSQEETFLFDCSRDADVQLRILSKNGEAFASNILRVFIERCLDSEVL